MKSASIKQQTGEDGYIRIGEDPKCGDHVTVKHGLVGDLSGNFEREIKGTDRLSILLNAINYPESIEIPKENVWKQTAS